MEAEKHLIPASAVSGIGTGLVLMAFFTCLWTGIAFGGLIESNARYALIIFPVFAIIFLGNGFKLYRLAKHYPKLTSEADIAEGKRMGKWFGIIFGAEGLGIFIGINVVANLGHKELAIPVMALVVGLHFYPMAKIFKRTIDYYLATWSTIVAICSIVFLLNKTFSFDAVLAFTGIGLAIATSCYGFYMLQRARALPKPW